MQFGCCRATIQLQGQGQGWVHHMGQKRGQVVPLESDATVQQAHVSCTTGHRRLQRLAPFYNAFHSFFSAPGSNSF